MRFALTLSIAVLLGACLAAQPPLQKWEYKTFRPDHGGPGSDDELNKLGAHGWELIAVFREANNLYHYTFKRPKAADAKVKPDNDDPAKAKLAKENAQILTHACMSFKLKYGEFPKVLETLLKPPSGQPFLDGPKALFDPWGKKYHYVPAGKHHDGFRPDIWSETPAGKSIGNWREESK